MLPSRNKTLQALALSICTGLGSGRARRAPGTAGTLAALLFWYVLSEMGFLTTLQSQIALAALTSLIGLLATHAHLQTQTESKDPQYVVIDEWAGLFITLIAIPSSPPYLPLLGFALFRLLDIKKPGPIHAVEKLPGAIGIMADDILAGLVGLAVIQGLLATL